MKDGCDKVAEKFVSCCVSLDYLTREFYGLSYNEQPTEEQTEHIGRLVKELHNLYTYHPDDNHRRCYIIAQWAGVQDEDNYYVELKYNFYRDGGLFCGPTNLLETSGGVSDQTAFVKALEEIGVGTCTKLTPAEYGVIVHLAEPFTAPTSGSLLDIIWRYIRAMRCAKESERAIAEGHKHMRDLLFGPQER